MITLQRIELAAKSLNQKGKESSVRFLKSKIGRITQYAVIVGALFLIGLDIWLVQQKELTISEIVHKYSASKLFVLSWIWGILTAHLLLARKKDQIKVPEWIGILNLIITATVLIFIGYTIPVQDLWKVKSHILFLLSAGCIGYFLWAQKWEPKSS